MSKEIIMGLAQRLGELVAVGFGTRMAPPRQKSGALSRIIAFMEITRPFVLLMGPPIVGAGAVLALNGFPSLRLILVGSLTELIAVGGMHSFNDWADRKRDLQVWPNRPVPSKRIGSREAFIFSLLLFTIALIMTYYIFNPLTFLIMLICVVLGMIYSLFARDRIGYLTLPLIVALHPVGGWAAFSPETLFTRIEPWLLFILAAFWQAGHIMVYSPGHPLRQIGGETKTELPSLFYTPSPYGASVMGVIFLALTAGISIWLYIVFDLGIIYLMMVVAGALLALAAAVYLVLNPDSQRRSLLAFNLASLYEMLLFGGILVDVFYRTVVLKYFPAGYEFFKANLEIITSVIMVLCALATAAFVFATFIICAFTLLVINREPLKKIVEDLNSF
jgi:4-hydroxybenzoate polyprenyltransferase